MSAFRTIEISDPAYESEGLRHVTVKSGALGRRADVTLWFPPGFEAGSPSAGNAPAVILLHGVYGSHWAWALKGGAHRTAAEMIGRGELPPMILAMPSDGLWGDGSGYVPHASGADHERWIAEEVPRIVNLASGIDEEARRPLFIAGLSMGGYGALRLAALYPDRFGAVSAHSSITKLAGISGFIEEPPTGFAAPPETEDIIDCITAGRARMGPVRFDCGLSDPLLAANRELHERLADRGIEHTYEEFPGGHEWSYWSEHLRDTFLFFRKCLP